MELSKKIRFLLLALYEKKYNGKYYDIEELYRENAIRINQHEVTELAKTLENDGLIIKMPLGGKIFAKLSLDGSDFLEENNFFIESSYLPQDRLKPLEKEILSNRLDTFYEEVIKPLLGDLVPAAEIEKEINELRSLLHILGRRSWIQILKGKFLEMSKGKIAKEEMDELLNTFDPKPASETTKLTEYNP
ncbi:MAG: hypothetical protein LPK09_06450 [Hymenobacteraceae bacterium]|nr:hypothetical protein [Hymenobacteraceae bacterium]